MHVAVNGTRILLLKIQQSDSPLWGVLNDIVGGVYIFSTHGESRGEGGGREEEVGRRKRREEIRNGENKEEEVGRRQRREEIRNGEDQEE